MKKRNRPEVWAVIRTLPYCNEKKYMSFHSSFKKGRTAFKNMLERESSFYDKCQILGCEYTRYIVSRDISIRTIEDIKRYCNVAVLLRKVRVQ